MKASYFSAAIEADDNRFLESVNMKVGAYTLDNTTIGVTGARHVTVTHTSGDTTDTLGTITVVGKNLAGQEITEEFTPVADDVVTGTKWFASVTSATGAGWVIDGSESTEDTVEIGYGADTIVAEGTGELRRVIIGTTAAGTITLADAGGTLGVLKASIVEQSYQFDCDFSGYLQVAIAAASGVTVVHSPTNPIYAST